VRCFLRRNNRAPHLEEMARFGFNGAGSGAYKKVFIHASTPWVVKVPAYAGGWRALFEEFLLYRSVRHKPAQAFFPETYWLDRFTMVQEKLPPYGAPWNRFLRKTVDYVASTVGVVDTHEGNIGLGPDGRWAFIDFAPSGISPIHKQVDSRRTALAWAR
jgi:hypothetical protein